MLSQLQASFQRVEQSLQRLTDSIAAYNPSASAAEDLVAANDAVDEGLEQLAIHQTNYGRIKALRQTAELLDTQLKSTVKQLADMRSEAIAIPSSGVSSSEESGREVKVDDLLAYAKFISKTTVPPTYRKPIAPPPPNKSDPANANAQIANGFATPPSGVQDPTATTLPTLLTSKENVATKAIDPKTKAWLDPLRDAPFEPWPSHDVIARGALAEIQRMVEGGQDPGAVLTAEEQAEADRRKGEEEERERLALEERERRRMSMFDTSGATRRRQGAADVFDPDNL